MIKRKIPEINFIKKDWQGINNWEVIKEDMVGDGILKPGDVEPINGNKVPSTDKSLFELVKQAEESVAECKKRKEGEKEIKKESDRVWNITKDMLGG